MALKPTDGELEILRVLWSQGPCTVRQVNEALNQQREVGYTTTLKLMQIMYEKKGLLARTRQGKTHLYRPLITEQETQGHLLDKLVDSAFHGSASQLILQALGSGRTTPDELDEIRDFLDQLDTDSTEDTI